MKSLNKVMESLIKDAPSYLKGDWLLVGGALMPALNMEYRSTLDIDMVPLKQYEDLNLDLMKLSENLGLPIETINPAASYYLYQIKDYKDKIILMKESGNFKLYRPNCLLYFELKLRRASPSDIEDCKKYFEYCRNNKEEIPVKKIKSLIKKGIVKLQGGVKKERLEGLEVFIDS